MTTDTKTTTGSEATATVPGTVLLTGATGGLGRALLGPIASRHPEHLVLLGRSPAPLTTAAQTARDAGAQDVSVVQVDLADLDSVARAGEAVTALVGAGAPPLSSLLLNAGIQMTDRQHVSAQGLELTFAVNVAAQHLLLESTAKATAADAHTVLVGSGTHYGDWHSYGLVPPPVWQDPAQLARPDLRAGRADKPEPKAGPRAYATSKLAVLHLARAWQTQDGRRRFNVYDPGLMPGTGLGRDLTGVQLWAWNHVLPSMPFLPGWSTPRRSAEPLAALALGETHRDLAGGYVEVGKPRTSSIASYDLEARQRLWQVLQELTAEHARPTAESPSHNTWEQGGAEPDPVRGHGWCNGNR